MFKIRIIVIILITSLSVLSRPELAFSDFRWSVDHIHAGMQALKAAYLAQANDSNFPDEQKIYLTSAWIDNDPNGRIAEILSAAIGHPTTGEAFVVAVRRRIGSWDQGLISVGLDPQQIKASTPKRRNANQIWDSELCLQGMRAIKGAGLSLNSFDVSTDSDGKYAELLSKLYGRAVTGDMFRAAVVRHVPGKWEGALTAIGEDPKNHMRPNQFKQIWDKSLILSGFIALKNHLGVIDPAKVRNDRSGEISVLLSAALGRPVNGSNFDYAVSRYIEDGWNGLAVLAGEIPHEVIKQHHFWTSDRIKMAFQALKDANLPMNRLYVVADPSGRVYEVLSKLFGRPVSGRDLRDGVYSARKGRKRSWRNALEQVGVDPKIENNRHGFWNYDRAIDGLNALKRVLPYMNVAYVRKDPDGIVAKTLSALFMRPVSGENFVNWIVKNYIGSWNDGLVAVGLDPVEVAQLHIGFWNADRCQEAIRVLRENGISPNYSRVLHDPDQRVKTVLTNHFKIPVTGVALIAATRKFLGKWSEVAGIERTSSPKVAKVAKKRESFWNTERCLMGMNALKHHKIPLHYSYLAADPDGRVSAILSALFERPIKAVTFYHAAYRYLNTWSGAIRAVGLDPDEVRAQGPLGSRRQSIYGNLPVQEEFIKDEARDGRRVKYLGESPTTPDEIVSQQEIANVVGSAISSLEAGQQELARHVLQALEDHDFETYEQMAEIVSQQTNQTVTSVQIEAVFKLMASNRSLLRALKPQTLEDEFDDFDGSENDTDDYNDDYENTESAESDYCRNLLT